jgi:hypothetical protein
LGFLRVRRWLAHDVRCYLFPAFLRASLRFAHGRENSSPLANARLYESRAIGEVVALVALPLGIALPLGRIGRYRAAKNCDLGLSASLVLLGGLGLPLPSPPLGSVRWHRTAPFRSLAGTLLLLPSLTASAVPHRLAPYCYPSLAGTPSARWLRSPTYLSPSCDLLYGRKPRLG